VRGCVVIPPTKLYSKMKLYLYLSCIEFNTVGSPFTLNISETTRKLLTPECSYEDGKQRIVAILMIHACLPA